MYIIKNVDVYSPSYMGKKDVLISQKIERIENHLDLPFEVIDGTGKILIPGLIDGHVHVCGGGGEAGFASKAPELQLEDFTSYGITTVLGLLGTDGYSRDVENLISKVKGLKEQGLNAYALCGAYQYPSITITGEVSKDILFIDEIIGCKLALSDHRSSYPTIEELTRLASQVRIGGMLSKKAGILVLHMGDDKQGLKDVFEIIEKTNLPVQLFRPTHVTRVSHLANDALKLLELGGYVDLTCGKECLPFIQEAKKRNLDISRITISSDGGGSYSNYDQYGNIIEIGVQTSKTLYEQMKELVSHGLSLQEALPFFTSNVSHGLKLNKGEINIGKDADLVLLDQDLSVDSVLINGEIHVLHHEMKKHNFYR